MQSVRQCLSPQSFSQLGRQACHCIAIGYSFTEKKQFIQSRTLIDPDTFIQIFKRCALLILCYVT